VEDKQEDRFQKIEVDMKAEFVSVGDELEVRGRIQLRDIRRFLFAHLWALYSLHLRALISIVDALRRQKTQSRPQQARYDILELAAVVDVFRRLRPYAFAAEGRCLLHALTLVKFLSQYDLYPEWVIGVTTQPWGAHSWVQWEHFLLDTNPEKVCQYTPIMVV